MKIMRCILLFLLIPYVSVFSAYTLQDGRLVNVKTLNPTEPIEDIFHKGLEAMEHKNWKEALEQMEMVKYQAKDSQTRFEALYYLGVIHYQLRGYETANKEFTKYLKETGSATHFDDVMRYKFAIAEAYQNGAKRHLFGVSVLPSILSGNEEAIELYDEVSAALPGQDIAAHSLFNKAEVFLKEEAYIDAAESYQLVIQRFPKTSLSARAFLELSRLYLAQSKHEGLNPDLLVLASLSMKHFEEEFPSDPYIQEANKNYSKMEELYAENLYDTGCLFERMKKKDSSVVYFTTVLQKFPNTVIAEKSRKHLERYPKVIQKLHLEKILSP